MPTITSVEELEALYGQTSYGASHKELSWLDKHCRHFISLSPFVVLGTASAEGDQDVTPRGDPAGFVKILDDKTILLPDRPGNRRLDSLRNVLETGKVGLVFMIPGVNETLRINGDAEIIVDDPRLEDMAVQGKVPVSALLITVRQAYLHCAKAFVRSKLWDPDAQVDRKSALPTLGTMLKDQISEREQTTIDYELDENYVKKLY
ncbi:pyridoxamine 5'-phosphate oxidase family protein [Rhodovibrionaceae bacterium A322]